MAHVCRLDIVRQLEVVMLPAGTLVLCCSEFKFPWLGIRFQYNSDAEKEVAMQVVVDKVAACLFGWGIQDAKWN